jgi:protein SCO1/2
MANITRRRMLTLPALAPFAGGILTSALGQSTIKKTPNEEVERQAGAREIIRQRYFPDVVLTTHEGRKVRFYEDLIKDKSVVLNMMYADCEGVCAGITANLVRVQKLLGGRVGRDIFFYSLTLKPEKDDPKALKAYVEMHGVRPGWLFLTGKPADVELLRRKLGFTNPDPKLDADTSQHIGNIRFGNEPLTHWAACPGLAKPTWIVEELSWVMPPQQRRSKA